eukprot:gene21088-27975_t
MPPAMPPMPAHAHASRGAGAYLVGQSPLLSLENDLWRSPPPKNCCRACRAHPVRPSVGFWPPKSPYMETYMDAASDYLSVTFSEASRLLDTGLQRVKATLEGSEVYKSSQCLPAPLTPDLWNPRTQYLPAPVPPCLPDPLISGPPGPMPPCLPDPLISGTPGPSTSLPQCLPDPLISGTPGPRVSLPLSDTWVFTFNFHAALGASCHQLFLPAFVHMDGVHLVSNLAAAIPPSVALERQSGSELFILELTALTALSHSLYVGLAWYQKVHMGEKMNFYSTGAVGLSSVAFALKVLLSHVVAPDASLSAHLCGVAAGLLHSCCVVPVASFLCQLFGLPVPRLYGAAAVRDSGTFRSGRQTTSSATSELVKWLKDTAIQASLFGAVCGAFLLINRNGGLKNLKLKIKSGNF